MQKLVIVGMLVLFCGCAGFSRECSSCSAGAFGTDWIVVQMNCEGKIMRCWELQGASVANEEKSDGIYWEDPATGNLVHLSNFYNRIQVSNGKWAEAFRDLGITRKECRALTNETIHSGGK